MKLCLKLNESIRVIFLIMLICWLIDLSSSSKIKNDAKKNHISSSIAINLKSNLSSIKNFETTKLLSHNNDQKDNNKILLKIPCKDTSKIGVEYDIYLEDKISGRRSNNSFAITQERKGLELEIINPANTLDSARFIIEFKDGKKRECNTETIKVREVRDKTYLFDIDFLKNCNEIDFCGNYSNDQLKNLQNLVSHDDNEEVTIDDDGKGVRPKLFIEGVNGIFLNFRLALDESIGYDENNHNTMFNYFNQKTCNLEFKKFDFNENYYFYQLPAFERTILKKITAFKFHLKLFHKDVKFKCISSPTRIKRILDRVRKEYLLEVPNFDCKEFKYPSSR